MPTTTRTTTPDELQLAIAELAEHRRDHAVTSAGDAAELVSDCIERVGDAARDWVDLACDAKLIRKDSPQCAEEILTGPGATLRYLQLLRSSLSEISRFGRPRLPGRPRVTDDGRLLIPVLPTRGLFDRVSMLGFRAHVWMKEGLDPSDVPFCMAKRYTGQSIPEAKTTLVLGAGNVSSIPPTDALSKLFCDGDVVLLKMSPVNDYLGPILERCLAPLIRRSFLKIVYGGADVGKAAIDHSQVDAVHITGSAESHARIVWGPPGQERD